MFLIKKLVSAALEPLLVGLVLVLAGLALFFLRPERRAGRRLVAGGAAVLLLFSMGLVGYGLTAPLEGRYPPAAVAAPSTTPATTPAELAGVRFVAVLGGGHVENPALPPVQQLNPVALGRLTEGIRLFELLDSATLIVSGWQGRQVTPHAEVSAAAAVSLGVPADRIVRFPDARDTAEELASIAGVVGDRPFLLVTSASHLPRAMEAAQRRGLRAIPAPAAFKARGRPRGSRLFVPDPDALGLVAAALHEYVGRLWYALSDG